MDEANMVLVSVAKAVEVVLVCVVEVIYPERAVFSCVSFC